MRRSKITALLVLVCFMSGTAFGGDLPYIPDTRDFLAASSPVVASTQTILNAESMNLASRFSVSPSSFRGNFGETLMRNYYSGGGDLSAAKTWYMLEHGGFAINNGKMFYSPSSEQGFDGLFMQFDARGNPSGVMVVESKYGIAELKTTAKSGKQMSDTWVRHRAFVSASRYKSITNDIQKNGIKLATRYPSSNQVTKIPLSNKQTALVWQENGQYWLYSKNNNVNIAEVQSSLRKVEQMLKGVADGKINARKILFRVSVKDNQFKVTAQQLDANGSEILGTEQIVKTMSGSYANLSPNDQELIKRSVVEAIRLQKYQGIPEAVGMERVTKDFNVAVRKGKVAEYIQKYNLEKTRNLGKTRFAWKEAGKTALTSGLYAGALAFAFSAVPRIWSTLINGADFDYSGLVRDTSLGFTSASLGMLAGTGMNHLLQTSSHATLKALSASSLQKVLSGTISGLVASAIFAYGTALWSGGSFRDGHRMMLTGTAATVGGVLTSYAIEATSISLSAITGSVLALGGPIAAGMFIVAAFNYGWSMLDENSRNERLRLLIDAHEKY